MLCTTLTVRGAVNKDGHPGGMAIHITGHEYKAHGHEMFKGVIDDANAREFRKLARHRRDYEAEAAVRKARHIAPVVGPRKTVLPRQQWEKGGDVMARHAGGVVQEWTKAGSAAVQRSYTEAEMRPRGAHPVA